MSQIIFDIETNGLLPDLDRLHCLVLRDAVTGAVILSARGSEDSEVTEGLNLLQQADLVIGHNIVGFDLPALSKLFPAFSIDPRRVRDTLLMARVLWPEIKDGDFLRVKKGAMPASCLSSPHSLKAWGYRLGVLKGDFADTADWSVWTEEMQAYCVQDTLVTKALWDRVKAKRLPAKCVELEHDVALLCRKITENGFPFDATKAGQVYAQVLIDKKEIEAELQKAFPPVTKTEVFVPKVNNSKLGYQKGVPIERQTAAAFNPASREQIAERLIERYGWEPLMRTEPTARHPQGQIIVDEAVLEGLPYPEAKLLLAYLLLEKREGSLAGRQGWIKLEKNGRIHADYKTTGAVTGRATHSNPNIAQVTKKCPRYGKVFRELFHVPDGWLQVGVDMAGLELRCFAHYLAPFDGGEYAKVVTTGDVHTANQNAAGLSTRDQAKTFIYGFLYGAGAHKLGSIVAPQADDGEKVKEGTKLKTRFLSNIPGIRQLGSKVSAWLESNQTLPGLDGRPLTVRHKHAALNTLLQSAGAILCKRWIVQAERDLIAKGLKHGWDGDFVFLAWVHDEIQIAARTPEIADVVSSTCIQATRDAGTYYDLRCPLDGESKIGRNWSETH